MAAKPVGLAVSTLLGQISIQRGITFQLRDRHQDGSPAAVAELAPDQASEHFHFAGVRGGAGRLTPNQFMAEVNVTAHGTGANYLFVDGRTENIAWTDVQRRLQQAESAFIVP